MKFISGASGFIGSNLAAELLRRKVNVEIVDDMYCSSGVHTDIFTDVNRDLNEYRMSEQEDAN